MIYFLKSDKYVKIGYSKNPKKRISILKISIPFEMEVIGIIEGDLKKESQLHRMFSKLRVQGEWFLLTEEIIDYIRSCKNLLWEYGFYDDHSQEFNPLKALRIERGLSLEAAAEKLNITRQSYMEAERRCLRGNITINNLAKYGKSLGAKIQDRFITESSEKIETQ